MCKLWNKVGIKMNSTTTSYFQDAIDPIIIEALNPYPKWIKWEIKRKYGKYLAVCIDVWLPYENLYALLPKFPILKTKLNMTTV